MGMDLSVYEVKIANKNEVGQEVSPYPLDPGQVDHYKALFGDLVYIEEDVDIEGLLEKFYPEHRSAFIQAWNFIDMPDNEMYIDIEQVGAKDSSEVSNRLTFTSEQLKEFVNSCHWINLASNTLYCKEHTYIRKPFRKSHTLDLSEVKGDTVILRSNNFAGTDGKEISGLMGETAKMYSMFFAGKEKLNVIKQLAQLSNDPDYWQKDIVNRIENEENMYLAINW